jgi:hypothetical protein
MILLLLALGVCMSTAQKVLLCHSSPADRTAEVRVNLMSTGLFSAIDVLDCGVITPDAASLVLYQSILVWAGGSFQNAAVLGNNLVR